MHSKPRTSSLHDVMGAVNRPHAIFSPIIYFIATFFFEALAISRPTKVFNVFLCSYYVVQYLVMDARLHLLLDLVLCIAPGLLCIFRVVTARVARMYRFCLVCVCVSVRVPKTDNFITTSHFAFTWRGFRPIQACLSLHLSVWAWAVSYTHLTLPTILRV